MNGNNLIIYKENVISKIRKFFFNLFKKEKNIENNSTTKNIDNKKNSSKRGLSFIQEYDKSIKLIQLQKKYKNGEIKESDLSEEEYKDLVDLYKKQNNELKNVIKLLENRSWQRNNDY